MAKRERSITQQDITKIVEIIQRFRTPPSWSRIVEKVQEEGLPFKKRSLQNHTELKAAYHKKHELIKSQRDSVKAKRIERRIPVSDDEISTLVDTLRARIAQLESENREYILATEAILHNADLHNIPREELKRPLARKN